MQGIAGFVCTEKAADAEPSDFVISASHNAFNGISVLQRMSANGADGFFSAFNTKNMFFLIVRNRVICYNNHGFIPMVSVITHLARRVALGPLSFILNDSIKGNPMTGKRFKNRSD